MPDVLGQVPQRHLAPDPPKRWKTDLTPSISVGNIAMGGRGKTPVVALVARLLCDAGERPAILSRGYRRRRPEDGVVVVSDGTHRLADLDRSGDEPLMLARQVPGAMVLVCDVRAVARAVAVRALGATACVLDDGFQHRGVAREVDLVLISASDLDDRRVPFGRLREPVRALARAHAVIVDTHPVPEPVAARLSALTPARVFSLRRILGPAEPIDARVGALAPDARVVVAAGIARPERFVDAVTAAGWRVADVITFADHHAFTARDLARLAAATRAAGAAGVVTTEKDATRLRPLRPLPLPVWSIGLDVSVEPADQFRAWLFERLAEARA